MASFVRDWRRGRTTYGWRGLPCGGAGGLYEACLQGQPSQVCAPPTSGLVADAVEVGADGARADVKLLRDLDVRASLGDQGDQFPFAGAELRDCWRRLRCGRGEHDDELG